MNDIGRGIPLERDVKLNHILCNVQKQARRRFVNLTQVKESLEGLYQQLQSHLFKKDIVGLIVRFDPNAQTFPLAYKYTPRGTQIIVKRTRKGWSVLNITRGEVESKPFIVYGLESRQEALAKFATKRLRTGCTL